jgi:hypothetical protein
LELGIQSMGFEDYFTVLIRCLGIKMTKGTSNFLSKYDTKRERKLAKQKTLVTKKARKRVYYEALKKKTEQAKSEIARRIGYYQNALQEANKPKERPPKKPRTDSDKRCRCGSTTHQQHPLNKAYVNTDPKVILQLEKDRSKQSMLDKSLVEQDHNQD